MVRRRRRMARRTPPRTPPLLRARPRGTNYWFCEDFDRGPLSVQWTPSATPDGSAAQIVAAEGNFVSSPRSLLAETPTVIAPNDPARARICRNFQVVPDAMTLDFDLYADEAPVGNEASIVSLRMLSADELQGIYVSLTAAGPNDWRFYANDFTLASPPFVSLATHPSVHSWAHVRFDVAARENGDGTVSGTAQATVNDVPAAPLPFSATISRTKLQLCVGIVYLASPADPWRVRFDNLTLDVKP
jgi:hypothetical protein